LSSNAKLTGRQHCGALNLEKSHTLMRGRAFQKPPRCWRSGEVIGYVMFLHFMQSSLHGIGIEKHSIL